MKKLIIIKENLKLGDAIKLMKEMNAKKDGNIYYYSNIRIQDPQAKRPQKYKYVVNYAVYCYIDE